MRDLAGWRIRVYCFTFRAFIHRAESFVVLVNAARSACAGVDVPQLETRDAGFQAASFENWRAFTLASKSTQTTSPLLTWCVTIRLESGKTRRRSIARLRWRAPYLRSEPSRKRNCRPASLILNMNGC